MTRRIRHPQVLLIRTISTVQRKTKWDIVLGVAEVIIALAAIMGLLLSAYQTIVLKDQLKEQTSINKPSFQFRINVTRYDSGNHILYLEYYLTNVGNRAATKFKGIIFPSNDLESYSKEYIDLNSIDEIQSKDVVNQKIFLSEHLTINTYHPIHFYAYISYADPLDNQPFFQRFYLQWNGILDKENNQTTYIFQPVLKEEFKSYIKTYQIDTLISK